MNGGDPVLSMLRRRVIRSNPARDGPAPKPEFVLPARSGPLDILQGRRILVLAHAGSLEWAASLNGRQISFRDLLLVLKWGAATCSAHLFVQEDHPAWRQRADLIGWTLQRDPAGQYVADLEAALVIGVELGTSAVDVVVLASNDRSWRIAWSALVRRACPNVQVVDALVPLPNRNSAVDRRRPCPVIELGLDCLSSSVSGQD